MANGLLEEIRRIAESSKDIPQEVVNRLMLTALAELVVKMDKHTDQEVVMSDSMDTSIGQIRLTTDALTHQMADINTKLTALATEITAIRSNPLVSLGGFIKRHPKPSLALAVILVMASFVLLSSRPFLIMILTLAGVPSTAIEQILLLISS